MERAALSQVCLATANELRLRFPKVSPMKGDQHMSTHELENKVRELRQLQALIDEA